LEAEQALLEGGLAQAVEVGLAGAPRYPEGDGGDAPTRARSELSGDLYLSVPARDLKQVDAPDRVQGAHDLRRRVQVRRR
jgi:hypothetical protein